jgi:hypothetical protein
MDKGRSVRRWLLIISAFFVTVAYFKVSPDSFQLYLVDAHVYGTAIQQWMAGADPYRFTAEVNFLYPPVFLYVGAALARLFTPHVGWLLYLALHIASSLSLPWILYRYYLKSDSMGLAAFYVLFFAAPGFLGLEAFVIGNIAVICYTVMLLAGVRGLGRNNWTLFYLAVFCCCSIKITFAPMLLLPLLCGERQLVNSSMCAGASVTGLLAQRWFAPSLFARFTHNLQLQTTQMGDVGKGLVGVIFHIIHKLNLPGLLIVPALVYGVSAIAIVAVLIVLKGRGVKALRPSWYSLVLVGLLFTIPRLNPYDLCVAFPLAFCFFTDATKTRQPAFLYLLLSIPSLFFLLRDVNSAFNGGLAGLAILAMWAWTCFDCLTKPLSKRSLDVEQSA